MFVEETLASPGSAKYMLELELLNYKKMSQLEAPTFVFKARAGAFMIEFIFFRAWVGAFMIHFSSSKELDLLCSISPHFPALDQNVIQRVIIFEQELNVLQEWNYTGIFSILVFVTTYKSWDPYFNYSLVIFQNQSILEQKLYIRIYKNLSEQCQNVP